jgi:GNAT superfamily N-acetyltransferase
MHIVRSLTTADASWKRSVLEAGWGSTAVARLGELIDASELPGLVVEAEGERIGLATFALRPDGLEVVTIQALVEGQGVGRLLMDNLRDHGLEVGTPRLWLVTTNDNVRAFGFYQRWGMDLNRVVLGGVERSRGVKPTIPRVGAAGIPVRHELQFELGLGPCGSSGISAERL